MKSLKRRGYRTLLVLDALIFIISIILAVSTRMVESEAHIAPDYLKIDITPITAKNFLSEDDYKILFYQTGLGKPAIDELRAVSPHSAQRIIIFQENFFKDIKYVCEKNSPISREESVVDDKGNYTSGTEMAPLHNGYILITKSSHTYGWRNGHSAIIIDAVQGKTLESVVLGTNSSVQYIDKWTNYPNFMLFRLKNASFELMDEISRSSLDYLNDIPYSFTVGIFCPKFGKSGDIGGTHCSHLVWQAFRFFGYDLDSDGGMIVTPKDIANSPHLEIVQVYGVDPENLWP